MVQARRDLGHQIQFFGFSLRGVSSGVCGAVPLYVPGSTEVCVCVSVALGEGCILCMCAHSTCLSFVLCVLISVSVGPLGKWGPPGGSTESSPS